MLPSQAVVIDVSSVFGRHIGPDSMGRWGGGDRPYGEKLWGRWAMPSSRPHENFAVTFQSVKSVNFLQV